MSHCRDCNHFTAKSASDATVEPHKHDLNAIGVCRRYPPALTLERDKFVSSRFPNVHREHSCGEFRGGMPV